jgi:ribosomal protein L37AE/L43A
MTAEQIEEAKRVAIAGIEATYEAQLRFEESKRWCATCQKRTTFSVNGIGMWICDSCHRDNSPRQEKP